MPHWGCAACAVEYPPADAPPVACPICQDERQFVPRSGQRWFSLEGLHESGTRLVVDELEPGLFGITPTPDVGINQTGTLVCTNAGNLLWDPPGFVDDEGAARVRELGGAVAIVASHPHMYGAQVSWSEALGGVPVLVAAADRHWVQREHDCIRSFAGDLEVLPGITIRAVGGHFPGSLVAYWSAGADGRGVLLAGDTIYPVPSGQWVTFMRSFPNLIPMSAAVVDRVAESITAHPFDRVYGNFGNTIETDARAVVRRSADRYMAWVRGDFDALT